MTNTANNKPVLLLILDGWGLGHGGPGNAIEAANPTCYLSLLKNHPWIPIEASGHSVGLPDGQIGNSEVGHMTMGAGRIVYQDLTLIDRAIANGSFESNPVFLAAMHHVKTHQSTLHLMGLVGPGGVHSHQSHLLALIHLAKAQGVEALNVHAFLDGRDVAPKSAEVPLQEIEETLMSKGYPQIQTVCGRYYAMDRDNRWDRVEKAYENLTEASGQKHFLSLDALAANYKNDVTDEFVLPAVCDLTFQGIGDNDAVLFFNFRPDRARQLTRAFTDVDFQHFSRNKVCQNLYFGCMTPYDKTLPLPVAFEKPSLTNILPEVISREGLYQFRCAETEKYAHVTYFFNGGIEPPFPGEDRLLIPSPKVATYDEQPVMSLQAVTDGVVQAIESNRYDFLVVNFANPDMIGHTGITPAAIEAVQAVDAALARIVAALELVAGTLLLTADHGNVETMVDELGNPHTAHTTNPVPCLIVSKTPVVFDTSKTYGLSNIAPTILSLLNLPIPVEMSAPSMLVQAVPDPLQVL